MSKALAITLAIVIAIIAVLFILVKKSWILITGHKATWQGPTLRSPLVRKAA